MPSLFRQMIEQELPRAEEILAARAERLEWQSSRVAELRRKGLTNLVSSKLLKVMEDTL